MIGRMFVRGIQDHAESAVFVPEATDDLEEIAVY